MEIKKTYNATGAVMGYCWGGGTAGYSSEKLTGYDTIEALIKEAESNLKDGTLDSGFGFESLKGAVLEIEEVSTVIIDKKDFHHKVYSFITIGEVTEEEAKDMIEFITYNP